MSASDAETVKINIQPGINRNTTEFDAEGGYVDCDKIRFRYGRPEKLGGWVKENVDRQIKGASRDINTWVDLEENKYIAFGTHQKLEIFNGGQMYDVTPVISSASVSNAIHLSAGSNEILVCADAHGREVGDFVVFDTVTASLEGIDFLNEYEIASAGVNYFVVLASTCASAHVSAGGGPLVMDFLYDTGRKSNGAATGWGADTWNTPGVSACGSAGWSKPRGGTGVTIEMRQWSLDNWGEDLLANPKGGPIYRWEASAGLEQRAQIISSAAPSIVNFTLVAQPARHVVAFGTHNTSGVFDPLLIRWSDAESLDVWNAAATNQAGSFRLESGSFIQGAIKTRREILVFTDEALHSMRRIGGTTVFQFDNLGKIPGIAGPHAAVDVQGRVMWMAPTGFYIYDGNIQPLPCSLQEYIFDTGTSGAFNFNQKEKVYAALNTEFNEVWWFYPAGNNEENSRYVIYNYLENLWYDGNIQRTVWNDVDIFNKPYATDCSGNLYIQEQGKNDNTGNLKSFLQTADFDIGDGDIMMFVDRVIPDGTFEKTTNFQLNTKKYPNSTEEFTKGPFAVTSTTRKFHPRVRGRQANLRYSTSVTDSDFRLGSTRLSLKPDGER